MIMNIKQRKIQIEPKTKLNYNIYKFQVKLKFEVVLTFLRFLPMISVSVLKLDP